MTVAIAQNENLAYISEATWNTTPATPTLQRVRYNSISTAIEKQSTESGEVTTSRETADIIQTSQRGGFGIAGELSYSTQFEDFMLGLLGQSVWTANVAKIGTTRRSFSFERQMADAVQFIMHRGAVPMKLAVASGIGNVITANWDFRGTMPTISGATVATANTAVGTNPVMDPISSIQLVQEGGAGSIAGPTDFSFELDNGIVDLAQLASVNPLSLELGEFRAKGKFSLYFQDATYFTKFLNHTTTSLVITLGGAASLKYSFSFAKVKLTALDTPNQGKNTPIVQTFEWQGFKDVTDTMVKVTRTP